MFIYIQYTQVHNNPLRRPPRALCIFTCAGYVPFKSVSLVCACRNKHENDFFLLKNAFVKKTNAYLLKNYTKIFSLSPRRLWSSINNRRDEND